MKDKKIVTPPEIKELDKKEKEAVENFREVAQKAISIIKENHFHLRLLNAVEGKK